MKKGILLAALLFVAHLTRAQENTFRLTVLGYQWTTTHQTLNFSWPGSANTSCNGNSNINGNISSSGNISANGTSSSTCSTTFTPPSNQTIDVQKPVIYILADSDTSRMVLTCTRNVRWSQCHALNPGSFVARNDNGHFEVQAIFAKGKEEWVRFDIVQQTAITKQDSPPALAQAAQSSIEAPESKSSETSNTDSEFPKHWKSMTSGTIRTVRFEGEYIYAELVMSEAATKAGAFQLTDAKKDGDHYAGNTNGRIVKADGSASCSTTMPIEFTLVTKDRIEGRTFSPPNDTKIDWNACSYSPPAAWQSFVWIPVR
jgi:hypothetical protein